MMTRSLNQTFSRGVITPVSIVVTLYLIVWLIRRYESLLSPSLESLLPEKMYGAGMRVIVGIISIHLVGLASQAPPARRVGNSGEALLARMPLVSYIHTSIERLMACMGGTDLPCGETVVIVKVGDAPLRMLGLATQEDLSFIRQQSGEQLIAVLNWPKYEHPVGGQSQLRKITGRSVRRA